MRLTKKKEAPFVEGDMTPMIDMSFQLIAFFTLLINFSDNEQDQRVHLPASHLAKPPDVQFEEPRFLHLDAQGMVLFGGEIIPIEGLEPILKREAEELLANKNKPPSSITMIIRADEDTPSGKVQEAIQACQDAGFEKFNLRAKAEESNL